MQAHACTPPSVNQLPLGCVCAGMRTCRYYQGRHFLQERSRTAKRINLAALHHRHSSSTKPRASTSMLLLPPTTPLLPPAKPGSAAGGQGAAAQLQEQHAGSTRRLAIPDPAFIPLEAPQELLQQSQQQQQQERDAGTWRQQHGYAGAGPGRQKGLAVTELVEQVGAPNNICPHWPWCQPCSTADQLGPSVGRILTGTQPATG